MYRISPFRSNLNTGYITLGHSTCVVKTCEFHGGVNTSSAKTTNLNWWVYRISEPSTVPISNRLCGSNLSFSICGLRRFQFLRTHKMKSWYLDFNSEWNHYLLALFPCFHEIFSLRMNFYEFLFDLLNVLRNLIFRACTLSWSSPTKTESWPLLWKHQSLLNNHPGKPLKQVIFDMPRILRVALIGILQTYTRIAFGPELHITPIVVTLELAVDFCST